MILSTFEYSLLVINYGWLSETCWLHIAVIYIVYSTIVNDFLPVCTHTMLLRKRLVRKSLFLQKHGKPYYETTFIWQNIIYVLFPQDYWTAFSGEEGRTGYFFSCENLQKYDKSLQYWWWVSLSSFYEEFKFQLKRLPLNRNRFW